MSRARVGHDQARRRFTLVRREPPPTSSIPIHSVIAIRDTSVRDSFLTEEEVATILQLAPKTLANWRSKRVGPPFTRCGRLIRYSETRLSKWTEARTEVMDGIKSATREMALPVRGRRPRMDRKHRFGRHRTQSEISRSNPTGSLEDDQAGKVPPFTNPSCTV
jgi:hypothetical protein